MGHKKRERGKKGGILIIYPFVGRGYPTALWNEVFLLPL